MSRVTSLYLHGLGREDLRTGERLILERNQNRGIEYVSAYINWRSAETYQELLGRIAGQANKILGELDGDDLLVLEGSSAGGSLAINVFKQLNDPRVRAVSHSGRLSVGNYPEGSWRSLARCAHISTDRASQSFFDSVTQCDSATVPSLSDTDKSNIIITLPLADEVVPVSTMTIDDMETTRVPAVGHSFGIALGMLQMPKLVAVT